MPIGTSKDSIVIGSSQENKKSHGYVQEIRKYKSFSACDCDLVFGQIDYHIWKSKQPFYFQLKTKIMLCHK